MKSSNMGNKYEIIKCIFSGVSTLIGIIDFGGKIVIIDTGTEECTGRQIVPKLKEMNIAKEDLYMIINTHTHGDHIGGDSLLKKYNKNLLVAVHSKAAVKMKDPYEYGMKIRRRYSNLTPLKPINKLKPIEVDISLKDGQIIEISNSTLKIIHTPGHDSDCICIYDPEEKILFSGDSIQGGGTAATGIAFFQNAEEYMDSIKKLLKLDIKKLILGHSFHPTNGIVEGREKVKDFLNLSLKKVKEYERYLIVSGLIDKKNLLEITQVLINSMGINENPPYIFLAIHTVDSIISRIRKQKPTF